MTNSEMLPCPFCGGAAQFHATYVDNDDWGWIDCDDCEASTAHGSRADCAIMWNTRPTPGEDKPLGIEEAVGRAVMQEVVRYGPDAVKRYARAAIEAYEQAHASTGEQ